MFWSGFLMWIQWWCPFHDWSDRTWQDWQTHKCYIWFGAVFYANLMVMSILWLKRDHIWQYWQTNKCYIFSETGHQLQIYLIISHICNWCHIVTVTDPILLAQNVTPQIFWWFYQFYFSWYINSLKNVSYSCGNTRLPPPVNCDMFWNTQSLFLLFSDKYLNQ